MEIILVNDPMLMPLVMASGFKATALVFNAKNAKDFYLATMAANFAGSCPLFARTTKAGSPVPDGFVEVTNAKEFFAQF
ncbi:MAG: hypothetical protein WCK16_05415 [Candidatus Moraniibacteriota bacterium]